MSSIDQFKIKKTGDSYILYDASIIGDPTLQLFNGDYHTNSGAQQNKSTALHEAGPVSGVGRAKVTYFHYEGVPLVLKHYYRGGFVARLIKDRYLGLDIENTRAFREWRLLKKMYSMGLPVPDAIAAHVQKSLITYRADLITREIENCKTLADYLSACSMPASLWMKIGACLRQFHQHDIFHADLNARNILITDAEDIYLIDFDNSYIRAGTTAWKMANLARLQRSLLKFEKKPGDFNFNEKDWTALLEGYKA